MTAPRLVLRLTVAVAVLSVPLARADVREDTGPAGSGCALLVPGSQDAPIGACLRCHAGSGSGHPVGLDYAGASEVRRGHGIPLRPATEAVRRGAFLPSGELRCTTCHDRSSPWRHRLALPPGAEIRPAVDPRDPATYDPAAGAPRIVARGGEVGTKPLCLLCHALD
jgi:hypothetical protein